MSTLLISSDKGRAFIGRDYNGKSLGLGFFAVSILLHIGLLLVMTLMQQQTLFNKKMPIAVHVDLVSYSPKLGELLKSQDKQSKKISTKKPDDRLKPKSVKKVVKKPVEKTIEPIKIKEKDPVKEKEPEPAEIIEAAKEDIKERVEEQEQGKIRDLLAEMREKVAEQEMQDDYEEEDIQRSGSATWRKDYTEITIYNSILGATVQKNFVFNKRLAKLGKNDTKPIVRVIIKIMQNGELANMWIETKSGSDYLDRQALKAIKKAAPFPALPQGYLYYNIGFDFTDKGLNN